MTMWRGAVACVAGAMLLSLAVFAESAASQSFTGVITDSECDAANHADMRMGKDDAECAQACIDSHGASYVLWDGKRAYALSDQRAPQALVGRRVTVVGTLDTTGKVITVESITAVKSD